MHIYAIQLQIAWQNKPANFARVRDLLSKNPPAQNSLILLPEMFATGFSMNTHLTAEPQNGETHHFLTNLARETNCCILAGLANTHPLRGVGTKCTNCAIANSPEGKTLADYAKLHPFSHGKEPQHFSPGNQLITFQYQEFTIAPTICYDLRFPELYRRLTQKGANLLTVIANWPSTRQSHWLTLLQARAIENQSYVIGCNRTGHDPYLPYSGRSLIIDPQGQILADAGNDETIIHADLSLPNLQQWRQDFPALSDLRQDLLP